MTKDSSFQPGVGVLREGVAIVPNGRPGFLLRIFRALKRGMLGKSSAEFLEHLTGSSEYWDRAIAARSGWPQTPPPGSDAAGRES